MTPDTVGMAPKTKARPAAPLKRKEVACMSETKRAVSKAFTFNQVSRQLGVDLAQLQETVQLGHVDGIASTKKKFTDNDVDLVANFYAIAVRKKLGDWARMLDHLSPEERRKFSQDSSSHPFPATY